MKRVLFPLLIIASAGYAQELVKDINTVPSGQVTSPNSYSQDCYSCGGKIFVSAQDAEHGRELWITDGTAQGTKLIKDILPGPSESLIRQQRCRGGVFYFSSPNVWKSDGTEEGTMSVTSVMPSQPGFEVIDGNVVYFRDNKLYTTTGEFGADIVVQEFDINEDQYISIVQYASTDTHVYISFTVFNRGDNSKQRSELWSYDGSTVSLVKTYPSGFLFSYFQALHNKLFLSILNSSTREVWVTDGTSEGTMLVKSSAGLLPQGGPPESSIVNDKVVISTENSTWVTDGTIDGTEMIIDNFSAMEAREFNGKLYFLGYSQGESGYVVKRTDSNYGNIVDVTEPGAPGVGLFGVINNRLLLAAETGNEGIELFATNEDGSVSLLKDIKPGNTSSRPRSFAGLGNVGVVIADDGVHGFELWKTDGTPEGTSILKDIATGTGTANITNVYEHDGNIYFPATMYDNVQALWRSDGTDEGTERINDSFYSGSIFAPNGKFLVRDYGLYTKTDLETGADTQLTLDGVIASGAAFTPNKTFAVGDNVFFQVGINFKEQSSTGIELWRANVVTNEMKLVKDIVPGSSGSSTDDGINGAVIGSKLIFNAKTTAVNPWITDGTEAGTFQLTDAVTVSYSTSQSYVLMNNKAYFVAEATSTGSELWVSDGTVAGTHIVKDIVPGPTGSVIIPHLAVFGDKIFFEGVVDNSADLWISDGTGEGTHILMDLPDDGIPAYFTTAGNRVYFVFGGTQLWTTNGTASGTRRIEFDGGDKSPSSFKDYDGALYFTANNKIFRTFGATESTQLIGPGSPSGQLFVLGNHVVFPANSAEVGNELFRLPLPTEKIEQIILFHDFDSFQLGTEQHASIEASSGGSVSVTSSNPSIAEYLDGELLIHGAGTVTLTVTQEGNDYFLPVTASIVITIQVTGLEDEGSVGIYPNPTMNTLFVKADSPTALRIVDMSGREKHRQLINSDVSIDVSSYADGMYVVILNNKPFKFIKRH